jgi:hypothetical protein
MAKGLVAAGSPLVSQNPAGWLRKAIEEDYAPPKTAGRHLQHSVKQKKEAKLRTRWYRARAAHEEPRKQHPTEEKSQGQTLATAPVSYQPTIPPLSTENQTEKTERESEITWNNTLEQLKQALSPEEVEARLNGTTLLEVTD